MNCTQADSNSHNGILAIVTCHPAISASAAKGSDEPVRFRPPHHKHCGYPLGCAAHANSRCFGLTEIVDLSAPARFGNSDRILQLRNIDSNKSFSIIYHGSSSCHENRLGQREQPSHAQVLGKPP